MADVIREFDHGGHKYSIVSNRHHGTEMASFVLKRDDNVKLSPATLLMPVDYTTYDHDAKAVAEMFELYIKSKPAK